MRGCYLSHKLELLLSFYLLGPLWAALAWLARLVRAWGGSSGWQNSVQERGGRTQALQAHACPACPALPPLSACAGGAGGA